MLGDRANSRPRPTDFLEIMTPSSTKFGSWDNLMGVVRPTRPSASLRLFKAESGINGFLPASRVPSIYSVSALSRLRSALEEVTVFCVCSCTLVPRVQPPNAKGTRQVLLQGSLIICQQLERSRKKDGWQRVWSSIIVGYWVWKNPGWSQQSTWIWPHSVWRFVWERRSIPGDR